MKGLPRALRLPFWRDRAPAEEADVQELEAQEPEAGDEGDEAEQVSRRGRHWHYARKTAGWTGKGVLVLVALFLVAFAAAWWRLSASPLELPALKQRIEAELSEARDGRPVKIDYVDLSWSGEPRALQLKARNVRLYATDGQELSTFREASIGLGVLPLFLGQVSLVRAEFVGGEISAVRKRDGEMHIAFGPIGSPADIVIPASTDDATLAERVNKWLDGLERTLRPVGRAGRLQSMALRGARLEIVDEGGGGRWRAENAVIALDRVRNSLALAIDARLEAANGTAPARLRVTTDTKFRNALVEFETDQARPRALLSPAMLGAFAGLDTPITAKITVGLDRRVGVNRFEGDVLLGRGGAVMAGQQMNLAGGRIHGRYDPDRDELVIDRAVLEGTRTNVHGTARISNASALLKGDPNASSPFELNAPSVTLDAPGVFAAPFNVQRVIATGRIHSADGAIELTRLEATREAATLRATGRITFKRVGAEQRLYPGIALDGHVTGPVDARAVMALWPVNFVRGARDYIDTAIPAGRVNNVVVKLAIPPEELAARQLTDPSLDISFDFDSGTVRYIDTMSPITQARGNARLQGNRFDLTLADGRVDGIAVSQGSVVIPRLTPRGALATITVRGRGEARPFVNLLMQQPIALGNRMPLDPATLTGRGEATFTLQRPNQSDVPFEQLRFTVNATFTGIGGTMRANGMAVTNGNLTVRGDQRAITIAGPLRIGSSDVRLNWTEQVGAPSANSSRYQISGLFDADDLERLGYPARSVSRGPIGVTLSGEGQGFDVNNADVRLDLARANVFLPRNFWVKRAGQPATAHFNVQRMSDGGYTLSNIDVQGSGLTARGQVRLLQDGRVYNGDITRLTVDGRADMAVALRRGDDGILEVAARGPLFDGAPFLDVEEPEIQAAAAASAAAAAARGRQPLPIRPMRFAIRADKLELRGGAVLNDANVNVTINGPTLQTLIVEGRSPGDQRFSLSLGSRPDAAQGPVNMQAADAGWAWRALTGADNILGGSATATGTWRMGPPNSADFQVRLENFKVVHAPAMAQLFGAVGSLRGLVELLDGEGISFTTLDAKVAMVGDDVTISEARMAGPAMGFTASGTYDIAHDNLDLDGVVVPSYGINSFLGNIPVLGNLLTSRRGEGVIGVTYSLNGTAAAPRVGVNPLSALTPGILRRIFEPFRPRRSAPPAAQTQTAPPG